MNEILTILLVEDNPGDVDLIRLMLAETETVTFAVKPAHTLSEAMGFLKENSIDLVLLDLGLPDSGGLDTFLTLHAAASDVPIIILTGNYDQEASVTAVKEGAQDYLVKGQINQNLIVRAIRYALERKQAEDNIRRQISITKAINRILQYSFKDMNDEAVVSLCLSEAEALTGSRFGWFGEVNQSGTLIIFPLNVSERQTPGSASPQSTLSQTNEITTVFERMLRDGQPLMINEPDLWRDLAGLLCKTSTLTSLLGIPLKKDGRTIGMIAVANKPSGYNQDDQESIEALSAALIEALEHKRAESENQRLRTAIEQAGEGIVITDTKGTIQYVNPAFELITGFNKTEVIG